VEELGGGSVGEVNIEVEEEDCGHDGGLSGAGGEGRGDSEGDGGKDVQRQGESGGADRGQGVREYKRQYSTYGVFRRADRNSTNHQKTKLAAVIKPHKHAITVLNHQILSLQPKIARRIDPKASLTIPIANRRTLRPNNIVITIKIITEIKARVGGECRHRSLRVASRQTTLLTGNESGFAEYSGDAVSAGGLGQWEWEWGGGEYKYDGGE
jgi:hypothetical protein